jgi:hypothetical protein
MGFIPARKGFNPPADFKHRTAAWDEPFGCELRVERLSRVEFLRVVSLCSVGLEK